MTDRERQVKRLVLTAVDECAVCGHEYDLGNVDVIGNRGDMWVLRVNCPRCQKEGFIAALITVRSRPPPSRPSRRSRPTRATTAGGRRSPAATCWRYGSSWQRSRAILGST
jgi:hypothetical protein